MYGCQHHPPPASCHCALLVAVWDWEADRECWRLSPPSPAPWTTHDAH